MSDSFADPTFSRSGVTDSSGKLDRKVEFLVSEEVEAAIITMATLARKNKSEWLREEVESFLFGRLGMIQRRHDQNI